LPPANGVNHLVGEIDNVSHARQRKLLAPAFSERALREQEPLITGYVDTMISKLRQEIRKGSSTLDIKNWMNYTTFDITGDLMFGESFGCLKDSQLHPWIGLIFKSIQALAYDGMARQFPLFHSLLFALVPKRVRQKAVEHFDLAARRVDRRLETDATRPDFMSAILQNGLSESKEHFRDGPRMMTRAEIHSNAFMCVFCPLLICSSSKGKTNDIL
jgi:cytochrome P450